MKKGISLINKDAKREYIIKIITSIVVRVSYLIVPFFYSYSLEYLTDGKVNKAYLFAGFLLLFLIIYYTAVIINDWAYEKLYKKIAQGLTKLSLDYTERNSIHSLSRITLGEYNSIMADDINNIADNYGNIPMFSITILELLIIFFYFFSVNWVVGIIALITGIIVFIFLYKANQKVNMINGQDKVTHAQRLGILQEYFFGMKEVKGFRISNTIHKRIEKSYDSYLNWHTKYGWYKVMTKNVALGLIEVTKVGVLIYGIYLATQNMMSIAVVILIYSYFDKMLTSVTNILDYNVIYQNSKVSMERLLKLEEYSQDEDLSNIGQPISRGVIDFKNVLYGNRADPILNHFTCHIPSRSVTVITGKTGAGKTGIIDLLLKLNRQHEGEILVDKIDINEYGDDTYFADVAAVRKNPTFFHMSIRDNLTLMEPDFEKIVNVCRELEIHDDIMRLHDGYDTVISETASNIPTDLKYMLSIARVVLKNPKILIFDETLTAFPKEVDLKLLEYFKKTKGKHNVIIISKERHVIEEADQVIFMIKGENIASGKHEVLLEKNKNYQQFYNEI